MRKRVVIGAAAVAAVASLGVAGAALGSGDDDGDVSVTGRQADAATAAALKVTGGGTANAVERDSEDGATWEVEVIRPDGTTVDVRLDEQYRLVVVEGDTEAE